MSDLTELMGNFASLANELGDLIQQQQNIRERIAHVRDVMAAISASRNVRYADDPESQEEMDHRLEAERETMTELIGELADVASQITAVRAGLAEASNALRSATIGDKSATAAIDAIEQEIKALLDPEADDDERAPAPGAHLLYR